MPTRQRPHNTVFVSAVCVTATVAIFVGLARVHATEREELKEPVYRVSKSNDLVSAPEATVAEAALTPGLSATVSGQPTGARPVIDHSAIPPADNPAAAEGEDDCGCESGATAEAATSPANLQSASGPSAVLDSAIAEAEQILGHVRANVDDYTCLLIKRENVNGQVIAECMRLKVRSRKFENGKLVVPFSVYVKFVKPQNISGREILYVEGVHKNQILAKEGGNAGRFLPSMWINTDSRFAMKGQRYPITEIGVENLAIRLIERGRADLNHVEDCEVSFVDGAKVGGRPCKLLTVKRPTPKTGAAANHGMNVNLAMVFIDQELNVPIRYGAYDWPENGTAPGPVIEEYTYHDLKTNVGLTDSDFDHKNDAYNF